MAFEELVVSACSFGHCPSSNMVVNMKRQLADCPLFSVEHECRNCAGTGASFFCEKCDVDEPGECAHLADWLDGAEDWDRDEEDDWDED